MADKKQDNELWTVVDALCASEHGKLSWKDGRLLPSRDRVAEVVESMRAVLFPGYFGISELSTQNMHFHVGAALDRMLHILKEQINRGICFKCDNYGVSCPECVNKTEVIINKFLKKLPRVQHILATDIQAAYDGDPAATCADETIFCYPGVLALTCFRIAHELYILEVPLIPRMITEYAHSLTGIDIHPGAQIEESFFIDHGTGVVVGETCRIGRRVRIYQGVTLGAKSFPLDKNGNPIKGIQRHPIVEDDVIIYSGATILGKIVIGKGSIIGGNVWITEDVPPGSRIIQSSTP